MAERTPLPYGTEDYRNAPSGEGPLAHEWSDKPHRLVYDLVGEVERLNIISEVHRRELYELEHNVRVFLERPDVIEHMPLMLQADLDQIVAERWAKAEPTPAPSPASDRSPSPPHPDAPATPEPQP